MIVRLATPMLPEMAVDGLTKFRVAPVDEDPTLNTSAPSVLFANRKLFPPLIVTENAVALLSGVVMAIAPVVWLACNAIMPFATNLENPVEFIHPLAPTNNDVESEPAK